MTEFIIAQYSDCDDAVDHLNHLRKEEETKLFDFVRDYGCEDKSNSRFSIRRFANETTCWKIIETLGEKLVVNKPTQRSVVPVASPKRHMELLNAR